MYISTVINIILHASFSDSYSCVDLSASAYESAYEVEQYKSMQSILILYMHAPQIVYPIYACIQTHDISSVTRLQDFGAYSCILYSIRSTMEVSQDSQPIPHATVTTCTVQCQCTRANHVIQRITRRLCHILNPNRAIPYNSQSITYNKHTIRTGRPTNHTRTVVSSTSGV